MYQNANWEDIAWVDVRPGVRRKAFSGQGATFAMNELQPHHAPKPHSHPFEQIVYIAAGVCDYHVADEVYRLTPGGMLVVPTNVEHYAEVVGDEVLVNFDIFTPRREEYVQVIAAELKEALKRGEGKLGTFVKLSNATAVEALGQAGLDFAILDTEHAPSDQLALEHVIRAADCAGLPTIVRVSDTSESNILKALDLGASGVQLPGLKTVEEVEVALSYTKYAPRGCRGLSFSQRSAGYGRLDKAAYMAESNDKLINVVHIENKEMAEQAARLCDMDDIDVLFIGPMDISQSLGHPGEPGHSEVAAVVQRVLEICRAKGKPTGIFVGTPDAARKYLDQGVAYIALGSELSFMTWGYKQMRANIGME